MKVITKKVQGCASRLHARSVGFVEDVRGQGTTEYAILVGVLVVIAIIAITLFRPKLQELWDAIASGINGL
ncbi:class III signal peptide-containing protein [Raoultibacter phocaeensis]|uniref:class III signal peptide-containing protein n=1 Tax=Raoultibacter phocaeensis TaxID=2479841 RepID=UPI00111AD7ED|nr:class III signal peptide-containing protein [Raoultibacter phocaeensis]